MWRKDRDFWPSCKERKIDIVKCHDTCLVIIVNSFKFGQTCQVHEYLLKRQYFWCRLLSPSKAFHTETVARTVKYKLNRVVHHEQLNSAGHGVLTHFSFRKIIWAVQTRTNSSPTSTISKARKPFFMRRQNLPNLLNRIGCTESFNLWKVQSRT